MEIIERKAVPIYESICPECKSVLQYKRSEVSFTGHITCPVCGVGVWANTIKPAKYLDKTPKEEREELENNIALLSSIRSGFNIFDDEERPFYHALSAAISALNKEMA